MKKFFSSLEIEKVFLLLQMKGLISWRNLTQESSLQFISFGWILFMFLSFPFMFVLGFLFAIIPASEDFFEMFSFASMMYLAGWVLASLNGIKMMEFLDFKLLQPFPLRSSTIFFASSLGSLTDSSVLGMYPFFMGFSFGLSYLYGFVFFPFFYGLCLLFLMTVLMISQVVVLVWNLWLRDSRIWSLLSSFYIPLLIVFFTGFLYFMMIRLFLHKEQFTRLQLNVTDSTLILPSTLFSLCLQSMVTLHFFDFLFYLFIWLMEFLVVLQLGSFVIKKMKDQEVLQDKPLKNFYLFYSFFRNFLKVFLGSTISNFIVRDLAIILRESSTKINLILPLCMSFFSLIISWGFSRFFEKLSQLPLALMLGLPEFSGFYSSFFSSDAVIHSWHLFLLGGLLLIASKLSMNAFGPDRSGISLTLSLPVPVWKIILSRNLCVFLLLLLCAIPIYIFVFYFGWHSFQSLHMPFLFFCLSVFLVFFTGNFLSVLVPVRMEIEVAKAMENDNFHRTIQQGFFRILFSFFQGFFLIPFFVFCVFPIYNYQSYSVPFSFLPAHVKFGIFSQFSSLVSGHATIFFYTLGAWIFSIFFAAFILEKRKEKFLNQMVSGYAE